MDKVSEAILALRPVSFRYKHALDPQDIPQFGLVAEQVEKVNPDLVVRDAQGKAYTVSYDAVNAMLLNEFLKQHRTVEQQRVSLAEQPRTIAGQSRKMVELEATVAQQQKAFQAGLEQQQHEFFTAVALQQKQIQALGTSLQRVSDTLGKPAWRRP